MKGDKAETTFELANLTYHLLVLMIDQKISLQAVQKELAKRHIVDHKVKQETMQ
ncbi:bifunctional phosphoribosyl-AMP cyclohydrolase/phosphoribosyl-ATP diphosphatase HisIE [Enterococcus cecorum]|nr:bifunctional phosphoribosyl-AMP cyclohydrolase/phosphoribosyl-ATP diphosphatase HisIE [Enterococcus cecorum]